MYQNYYSNLLSSSDPENSNNHPNPPHPNPPHPNPPHPNPPYLNHSYPSPYPNPPYPYANFQYQNYAHSNVNPSSPNPNSSNSPCQNSIDPLENVDMEHTPEDICTDKKSKSKKYWTKEEEILLVKAWLHISDDSIVGTSQRDKEFWQRISRYYDDNNTSDVVRTQQILKSHWHYVNRLVNAFNQIYLVLKSQHISGWSEEDFRRSSFQQYTARFESNFKLEHVWNMVKNQPKWQAANATYGATRCSFNEPSINLEDVEVSTRPIGTKAAKKAAKGKSTNSTSSGSRVDELFEKHMVENNKNFERYQQSLDTKNELKKQKINNAEMKIFYIDPSTMSEEGREIWRNRCEEIKIKYNL